MTITEKIRSLTSQLYPTGLAFRIVPHTWREAFDKALTLSEAKAYETICNIRSGLLPDNEDFTTADAEGWERALALPFVAGLTLEERKLRISRKIAHPGGILNRQSANYLELQLHREGFTDVKVYENDNLDAAATLFGNSNIDLQANDAQCGERLAGEEYPEVLTNSKTNDFDLNFMWGVSNLRPTFLISGDPITTAAGVDANREQEFRELILKTKPAQTVAWLNINYV